MTMEDAEDSISESESVEQRQHLLSTKPGEASMQDIIEFLSGDAVLEMSGDLEIPPDLAELDDVPKKKTQSFNPEVDGEAVNDDQDVEVT